MDLFYRSIRFFIGNNSIMNTKLLSKNYVLIAISATLFYTACFMINTVTVRFVTDSGGSKSLAGVVAAVFTLASFFTRPLWGWLTDKNGRKIIYLLGGGFCLLANGLLWFSTSVAMLLVARVLSGVGYSALTTAGGTIVCDVVPKDKLQQGIAVYGVTNVLSQAVAPVMAIWLYKIDFICVVLSALIICVLVIFIAIFIKYKENKFINKNQKFRIYTASALPAAYTIIFFAMATASINSFIPVFAQQKNLSADSWFFLVSALFLLFARLLNKKLVSLLGDKKLFYVGDIVYISAFIILIFCSNNFWLLMSAVVYGCGAGLIHPIVNTAAVKNSTQSQRGGATSTFMMSQDLGMTIGSFLWGTVSENIGFEMVYSFVAILLLVMMYIFRKFLIPILN